VKKLDLDWFQALMDGAEMYTGTAPVGIALPGPAYRSLLGWADKNIPMRVYAFKNEEDPDRPSGFTLDGYAVTRSKRDDRVELHFDAAMLMLPPEQP